MPPTVKAKGTGTFQVEVTGESHYEQNLESICGKRSEDGVDLTFQAALILEDDNPYDSQAVRVEIKGKTVGYLSRDLAPRYRAALAALGHAGARVTCPANIRGGWDRGHGDRGHYGVRLDLPAEFVTPPATTPPAEPSPATPTAKTKTRGRRWLWILMLLALVIVLGFVACVAFGLLLQALGHGGISTARRLQAPQAI